MSDCVVHDWLGFECRVCRMSRREWSMSMGPKPVSQSSETMIDIDDMRKRHANSIRNTATGRALGLALEEIERLREEKELLRDLAKKYESKLSGGE
jgi:hypothetical protein